MREIKFRVWQEDKMIIQEMNGTQGLLKLAKRVYYDNYTWMQYTGLKEKNGKEIYEGDILSFDNDDIKFKGIACYYVSFENGYWCGLDVKKERKLFCHNFRFKHTEIVGNIHQNPELLKP